MTTNKTYAEFKTLVNTLNLFFTEKVVGHGYTLIAFNESTKYRCEVATGSADETDYIANLQSKADQPVTPKNKDGVVKFQPSKSYLETSKEFVTVDFSDKTTWFYTATAEVDKVLTDSGDQLTYNSSISNWIDLDKVTNRNDFSQQKVVVKVDDIEVTTGYTVNYANGTVTFDSSQEASVIKASFYKAVSCQWDLVPSAGKTIKIDYVETQFTKGCIFPTDYCWAFQPIYNGPAIPPNALGPGHPGLPADTDIVLKTINYNNAKDFLNRSNGGVLCPPFGELTKETIILPWNYLTGNTIYAPGSVVDLAKGEFHKLRLSLVKKSDGSVAQASGSNNTITQCEIATGTFYAIIEDI